MCWLSVEERKGRDEDKRTGFQGHKAHLDFNVTKVAQQKNNLALTSCIKAH
jgi:hypothetical protein